MSRRCAVALKQDGAPLICASVSFPTRWDLPSKLGTTMMHVHSPVYDYDQRMGQRVDRFLQHIRIASEIWRAPWRPCLRRRLPIKGSQVGATCSKRCFSRTSEPNAIIQITDKLRALGETSRPHAPSHLPIRRPRFESRWRFLTRQHTLRFGHLRPPT